MLVRGIKYDSHVLTFRVQSFADDDDYSVENRSDTFEHRHRAIVRFSWYVRFITPSRKFVHICVATVEHFFFPC